ncbi:MAG TPA: hypothetical protein VEP90_13340 [Methylomirabilota bacterium]|nr:hypothetical protein [Methylomirabilota bacterium]
MDNLLDDKSEPAFDETKNYFEDLVGEGRKFKDEKELAKSKVLGDLYIKDIVRQKDELANSYIELKAQYDAQAKLVDLVDRIGDQKRTNNDDTLNVIKNVPDNSIDLDSLDKRFEQLLSKREKVQIENENLKKSQKMLKEGLGDNYVNVIRSRIDDLDLSEEDVNALAKRSPKTLARVLGIELEQKSNTPNMFQSPPVSQRRSDTFKPAVQKRTWSYYQEQKKTNPRIFLDPKIAIQMHDDHIALGSAFEDGDFHQNQ